LGRRRDSVKNNILRDKLNPPPLEWDEELDDEELFRRAMAKVTPLSERVDRPRSPRPGAGGRTLLPIDFLREALAGMDGDLPIDSGDYLEGGAQGWNRMLLKKLREGGFSVQAELDLHGLYQDEALERTERFLQECSRNHLTCVRIIHGKGKNSRNNVPVLKNKIGHWLSLKRMSRYVVAYTSARPVDGGEGAMYVLLRPR
jgi:DNA-nicking Smr family endonuclease